MRDRITELESAVNRLESNVDGLRSQLVEANDRIRQLERDLAAELVDEPETARLGPTAKPESAAESAEESEPEAPTDETTADSTEDIIVA